MQKWTCGVCWKVYVVDPNDPDGLKKVNEHALEHAQKKEKMWWKKYVEKTPKASEN